MVAHSERNEMKCWTPSPVKASLSEGGGCGGEAHQKGNNEVKRWRGDSAALIKQQAIVTASLTDYPPTDSCLPRTQAELLPSTSMPWRATCSPRHPATACPTLNMHRPVPTEKLWRQRLRSGCLVSARDTETPRPTEVKRSSSLKTP